MTREYLLEDDEMRNDLELFKEHLLLKQDLYKNGFDSKSIEKVDRLGYLSNILKFTQILGYDMPELMQKQPVGFHTENTLFISNNLWQKIKDNLDNSNIKDATIVVSNMLLDLVEDTYSYSFSDEDRLSILKEILPQETIDRDNLKFIQKIGFISCNDLSTIAQNAGIDSSNYAQKFGVSTDVLNANLFRISQLHHEDHPLHALSNNVIAREVSKVIPSFEPSVQEFEEHYAMGFNPESRHYALQVLEHKISKSMTSLSISKEAFFKEVKNDIAPYYNTLSNLDLVTSLDYLKDKLEQNGVLHNKFSVDDYKFVEDFLTVLVADSNESQRIIMIKSLVYNNSQREFDSKLELQSLNT